MASVKKHLQNLHPELFNGADGPPKMESLWRMEKIESQQDGVNNVVEKTRKVKDNTQTKKETKEETKNVIHNISSSKPLNIMIIVYENEAKEDPLKSTDRLMPNQVMSQYYPPIQSDMFPLAYRPSFIYPQQNLPNYDFLCMFQTVNQNASVTQPNLWMPKVTESVAQQAIDPLMPSPVPYPSSTVKPPHYENNFDPSNDLLARAIYLSTIPSIPVPKREHPHVHGEFCGHTTVRHDGHIDYIHDAELHYINSSGSVLFFIIGEVFPHKLAVTEINPDGCRPLITHPWHADGPAADLKEEKDSYMDSNDANEANSLGLLMNLDREEANKNPKFQTKLVVFFPNALEGLS